MIKKVIVSILILTVIVVVIIALYYSGNIFISKFFKLSPNVGAAIIAGLAAVSAAIYNQRQTRKREIEEKHRERKIELYSVFMDIIDFIFELSRKKQLDRIQNDSVPPELEKMLKKFRRGLLFWASPNVISAYQEFQIKSPTSGNNILRYADKVYQEIRKDLGNSNWGLKEGDLMKLFLKNPNEYDLLIDKAEQRH